MIELKRRWFWRTVLAMAVGTVIWIFWPRSSAPSTPLTTEVSQGDIEDAITVQGVIEPIEAVAVGAQVSGQIKVLHVRLGQLVKAGDPVADIDSAPQKIELSAAESSLAAAEAQRDAQAAQCRQVERVYRRQEALLARQATANSNYEQAEAAWLEAKANVAALEAQIARAQIDVESARVNLAYTSITAPISGTVIAIAAREGQTVNAMQASPTIVVIARLDEMAVKVQISEADIARVITGQDVWFTLMGGDTTRYEATLDEVDPAPSAYLAQLTADAAVTQATRPAVYFNGRFTVPNSDNRLRPMMTAEVHLIRARAKNVTLVLSSALSPADPERLRAAEVLTPAGRETRQVVTGLTDGSMVEVREGLLPGEQVILPMVDVMPK